MGLLYGDGDLEATILSSSRGGSQPTSRSRSYSLPRGERLRISGLTSLRRRLGTGDEDLERVECAYDERADRADSSERDLERDGDLACFRLFEDDGFSPFFDEVDASRRVQLQYINFSFNYRANMTNATYLLRLSSPLQSLFFFEDESFLLFDLDLLDFVLVRPPSRCCCCWGWCLLDDDPVA